MRRRTRIGAAVTGLAESTVLVSGMKRDGVSKNVIETNK